MISNQKLLNSLEEMKEISGLEAGLFDKTGKLVCSTASLGKQMEKEAEKFALSAEDCLTLKKDILLKITVSEDLEYVLYVKEASENQAMGRMMALSIRNQIMDSMEHVDRNHFIQNILLGNMLTVDIYAKAKKLHIEESKRIVYVIDSGEKRNDDVMELVKNLSDMKSKDFVTSLDEHSVVLVKDLNNLKDAEEEEYLEDFACTLADNIHMEAMIPVRVGYGNPVWDITKLTESFQEAKMALEVAKVFYAERETISYGKLGIGRLIYQLPMSLCEMFIKEVFGDKLPDVLEDEEAMSTISKFFENNLNISETARQLYVHRNTLVYRLERIEKSVGLDIRAFDDAMTFRIAVMVLAHMKGM